MSDLDKLEKHRDQLLEYFETSSDAYNDSFSDRSIRRSFARKVFLLLLCLVLKTVAICAICIYCEPVAIFLKKTENQVYIYGPVSAAIVTDICLLTQSASRKFPYNYFTLFAFTTSVDLIVGFACASEINNPIYVFIALGAVILIVFMFTMLSIQPCIKVSFGRMAVFTFVMHLISTLIFCFTFSTQIVIVLEFIFGLFVVSEYLLIDMEFVMKDAHGYSISPEDYVLAVILLYTDFINILVYIIKFIIKSQDNKKEEEK